MTGEELNKRFAKTVREIESNIKADIMVRLGVEALRFIKERVIETGVDAKGKKYAPYSTKPTLVGCKTFVQKSACQALLGSKEKRKKLEWRTVDGHKLAILPGGYRQIRQLQGRQVNHVDFSVSNNMWSDINIISNPSDHNKGTVIIGARKESEKRKLEGNTKRKGDILDLNQKEIDDLLLTYKLKAIQIFRNNGL